MNKKQNPKCFNCKHFYNTWAPKAPYGCRAFGFKSKQIPSLAVKMNSGNECQAFEESKRKAKARTSSYE